MGCAESAPDDEALPAPSPAEAAAAAEPVAALAAPLDMKAVRARLTDEQWRVTQHKATEWAFTGAYHNHKADGTYACIVCALPLFSSATKFDSGTGWPSFWQKIAPNAVRDERDDDGRRVEVLCNRCGAHLGHVFNDGPRLKTGLRYCINSASLQFDAAAADGAVAAATKPAGAAASAAK